MTDSTNCIEFACPACTSLLQQKSQGLECNHCNHIFNNSEGIEQLYMANDEASPAHDITDKVKAFYEDKPFPNYDDFDSVTSLISKAQQGYFARLLDEQIPPNAKIIECGCGTAQLSNFLSIKGRKVIAADLCLNSLRLGKQFADSQQLTNVRFVQMNLFKPPFTHEQFHLVISNGVLHHTGDPQAGFEAIAKLVKPGGYIMIGLYHYWGRLITDLRRFIFNVSGNRFKGLDPNLRKAGTKAKQEAWFNDQYKHPHESKHTIREVAGWLKQANIEWVRSIPDTHLFRDFSHSEQLFNREPIASNSEALLREMAMVFKGSQEGGFFTIIGRKPSSP